MSCIVLSKTIGRRNMISLAFQRSPYTSIVVYSRMVTTFLGWPTRWRQRSATSKCDVMTSHSWICDVNDMWRHAYMTLVICDFMSHVFTWLYVWRQWRQRHEETMTCDVKTHDVVTIRRSYWSAVTISWSSCSKTLTLVNSSCYNEYN